MKVTGKRIIEIDGIYIPQLELEETIKKEGWFGSISIETTTYWSCFNNHFEGLLFGYATYPTYSKANKLLSKYEIGQELDINSTPIPKITIVK